jgi:hypothetical protein
MFFPSDQSNLDPISMKREPRAGRTPSGGFAVLSGVEVT